MIQLLWAFIHFALWFHLILSLQDLFFNLLDFSVLAVQEVLDSFLIELFLASASQSGHVRGLPQSEFMGGPRPPRVRRTLAAGIRMEGAWCQLFLLFELFLD
jgi:hypothetical protein